MSLLDRDFAAKGFEAKPAIEASFKKGAITILLLDGPAIAKDMIERGIGVRRQPVFLLDLDPDFFDFDDA